MSADRWQEASKVMDAACIKNAGYREVKMWRRWWKDQKGRWQRETMTSDSYRGSSGGQQRTRSERWEKGCMLSISEAERVGKATARGTNINKPKNICGRLDLIRCWLKPKGGLLKVGSAVWNMGWAQIWGCKGAQTEKRKPTAVGSAAVVVQNKSSVQGEDKSLHYWVSGLNRDRFVPKRV